MRKKGRLLMFALCAFAFFLFLPALVDGPGDAVSPPEDKPFSAVFLSTARLMESQTGDQSAMLRVERPEGIAYTCYKAAAKADVKADANGHPLRESTYIKAVYQAFRLEEKSG